MRCWLCAGIIITCAANSLGAVVAVDTFDAYTVGDQLESGADGAAGTGLNGGTGFTGPYNVLDTAKSTVTIQTIDASNAVRFVNGINNDTLLTRPFPAQSSTVYFSFTFRTNNPLTAEDFTQLGLSSSAAGEPPLAIGIQNNSTAPSKFFVRANGSGNQQITAIDVQPDTTYLMVGKASQVSGATFNRIELFLDPGATEPGSPTAIATSAGGTGPATLGNFTVRTARLEATDVFSIDNLRIGTTFADVVPEPASIGVLVAAACGALASRRRRT